MESIVMHKFHIPVKGVKKKVIYHFSDTHLTEYDSLSDTAEKEKAIKQTAAWENVRSGFASAYNEPFEEAQKISGKEHFENLLRVSQNGDAVVMAGDILDYVNGANLRIAEKGLSSLNIPFIAVCGNHEKPDEIPAGGKISVMKNEVQTIEFDDLILLGFDNSKRIITSYQKDELSKAFGTGKTVIIALHVPIMTKDNEAALRKAGEYFQLNYDGCPKENIEFIEMIKKNSHLVAAVLAGHLHFNNISLITEGVTQYVSSQGITGNINEYTIGE